MREKNSKCYSFKSKSLLNYSKHFLDFLLNGPHISSVWLIAILRILFKKIQYTIVPYR